MDPLTHSFLGMACAMVVAPRHTRPRQAALAGLAAGLLPDADVFLRNAADPLFFVEYHRHFTHSLAFSPVIALVAASIAWALYRLFSRQSIPFLPLLLPAWVAGLSHIYCDVWTSYGTRVWWPFTDARVSLDWVAVVDPLLTLPLAIGTIIALRHATRKEAVLGLAWVAFYLAIAVVQHDRARSAVETWLAAGGHRPQDSRITIKPSFANIIVWRAMVQEKDKLRVISVHCGIGPPMLIPSPRATEPIFASPEAAIDAFHLPTNSRQAVDIRRFFHFSDNWVGVHPDDPLTLGDLRYATLPNDVRPLWGIRLKPGEPDSPVEWRQFTEIDKQTWATLWNLIWGKIPEVNQEVQASYH